MYSPKIRDDLIPTLYWLAKERKMPMTRVVDRILRDALGKREKRRTGVISEDNPEQALRREVSHELEE